MPNELIKKHIIDVLKNTKEEFCINVLKNSSCAFCAEGVILYENGFIDKDSNYLYCGSIRSIEKKKIYESFIDLEKKPIKYAFNVEHKYDIVSKLRDKIMINFEATYINPIPCNICLDKCDNLNTLIIHINDAHSKSHKQTAKILEKMCKKYDLETGEIIE